MANVEPFPFLADVFKRPAVFYQYTADRLWQDEHISQCMLDLHLDKDAELASRPYILWQEELTDYPLSRSLNAGAGGRICGGPLSAGADGRVGVVGG
jgi:hypothetical protein